MSYYSRYHRDASWLEVIICFALVILMMVGLNTCTASEWNDGLCPDCETRYELRGASRGLKYYSCPECGNEVSRY